MITDKNRPDRWGGRFGYQLVSERAVLRFGPVDRPDAASAAERRDAAAPHRPAAPAAPAPPLTAAHGGRQRGRPVRTRPPPPA